jgi:hypothetical protein
MNLFNKTLCLLLLGFLVIEIFPQEQYYISTNGNINDSFPKRSIYNVPTITPLKNNNSAEVLDSLIYISTYGDRNRIAYNYNDDLSLNYFTRAVWYNNEWITLDKHTNTYNSDGNLESVLWEWFNNSSGEWFKDAKDVYNYDSLENRIFHLHQFFNGQDFVNNFKYENYFDGRNLLLSVSQKWIDNEWINRSKSIYKYTPEKVNDTILFQIWTNDQWLNYYLGNYEYDEKLNINTSQTKIWQEQQWIDYALGKFDYDENNNLVLENFQKIVYGNWENWFRIFYEYDDNNNLIHLFGEEWKNDQWVPENEPLKVTNPDGILYGYLAKEIFLYYSKPTSVESEKNIVSEFNLLQNYPNPFNPNTVISYNIPEHSLVTLNIYNLLGEKIKTLIQQEQVPGKYQINFDGNNLPSGIYFYQLKTDKFQQTKKMLILR